MVHSLGGTCWRGEPWERSWCAQLLNARICAMCQCESHLLYNTGFFFVLILCLCVSPLCLGKTSLWCATASTWPVHSEYIHDELCSSLALTSFLTFNHTPYFFCLTLVWLSFLHYSTPHIHTPHTDLLIHQVTYLMLLDWIMRFPIGCIFLSLSWTKGWVVTACDMLCILKHSLCKTTKCN